MSGRHACVEVARVSQGRTYQTRKDLCWTGGRETFALGWEETVFEDVLYPWGILEVSVGLLEWGDGMIGPQLRPELREDCGKGVGEQTCLETRTMGD